MFRRQFKGFHQRDAMDCGAACLLSIARFYGRNFNLTEVREHTYITSEGVSLRGIVEAANNYGFKTKAYCLTINALIDKFEEPCILHWNQNHFVVLYRIKKRRGKVIFYVFDPGEGRRKLNYQIFMKAWGSNFINDNNRLKGVTLFLTPTRRFYLQENSAKNQALKFKNIWKYSKKYKKVFLYIFAFVLLANLVQFILPFLTRMIVDEGIEKNNSNIVFLILIAQLLLYLGINLFDFIRNWLLLQVNSRITISMISDFLYKMTQLPIRFFDNRLLGDLIQRINDHSKIEHFLTSTVINVVFSFTSLVIFGLVLCVYDYKIFLLFMIGSVLHILWIYTFLSKRKEVDYARFIQQSVNSSSLVEFIRGMKDIKLYDCQNEKRWVWERIQVKLLTLNLKSLTIEQYQNAGSLLINQIKNTLITYSSAKMVIDNELTIGTMLSIQFIVGQLEGPLNQTIDLLHSWQDARISFERLGEVHEKENELRGNEISISKTANYDIVLENISFQYNGPFSPFVIKDLNLTIPHGKTTAIVGTSGSGKTTLLKLILGFYNPTKGDVLIGDNKLRDIDITKWRNRCGVVLQDCFIFSDTILNNIAMSDSGINFEQVIYAAEMANILGFINSLPLKFNTNIGADGHGLSQGQQQRILLARLIYKNPDYLFFDESTNSLDAKNEKEIMCKLNQICSKKTAIFIAHRFSTIKNADQIIVLEEGTVIESGTHSELMGARKNYYSLMKNQLNMN